MGFMPEAATVAPVVEAFPTSYDLTCFDGGNFGGTALTNNAVVTRGQTISCRVNGTTISQNHLLVVEDCAFSSQVGGAGSTSSFITNK